MSKPKTPLLDELEKGPWPSFVKEMKQAAEKKPMAKDLMGQLELSYKDKIGHWKHGGIVGVKGYGGGVIGRYSDRPDLFPGVEHFHTMRVNQPTGWFYTTKALRKLCDIWDKHGSGLTNMHGSTGDIILLGTTTDHLQPCFDELSRRRLRPGRIGFGPADPQRLRGTGPLRVGLHRQPGHLLQPHHALPGSAPPPHVPLQVQDQDLGLRQRLRGLHRPGGPLHHRHLEGEDPDRPEGSPGLRRLRPGHPGGGHRPLPDEVHELG